MDISIALPHTGQLASPQAIVYVAQEAERRGYPTVWVLERLLRPRITTMPASYGNVYEPIETLTYVAAKTERIKLGTSVIDALLHMKSFAIPVNEQFQMLDRLRGSLA